MILSKKKVLVISVSWIGNTILQSPTINSILQDSRYEVDILFGNHWMAWVYKYNNKIKEKFILSDFLSIRGLFLLFIKLFSKRYDFSVACFPSKKIAFNLIPFICWIKNRCIHNYSNSFFTFSCLSNKKILASSHLHDVEQNLNLLVFLQIQAPQYPKLYFGISDNDKRFSLQFLHEHHLDTAEIIGIHPGAGPLSFKKWESYKYVHLIHDLNKRGFKIIVFWTPEELSPYTLLSDLYIFWWDINQVAALISCCKFFVSGDTWLMHIAATLGVEQVVIWKGTSFSRTAPRNQNAKIVFVKSSVQYNYPF